MISLSCSSALSFQGKDPFIHPTALPAWHQPPLPLGFPRPSTQRLHCTNIPAPLPAASHLPSACSTPADVSPEIQSFPPPSWQTLGKPEAQFQRPLLCQWVLQTWPLGNCIPTPSTTQMPTGTCAPAKMASRVTTQAFPGCVPVTYTVFPGSMHLFPQKC